MRMTVTGDPDGARPAPHMYGICRACGAECSWIGCPDCTFTTVVERDWGERPDSTAPELDLYALEALAEDRDAWYPGHAVTPREVLGLVAEVRRLRADVARLRADGSRLRAVVSPACSCGTPGLDYAGPLEDCEVHGQLRRTLIAERDGARAEVRRLRAGVGNDVHGEG